MELLVGNQFHKLALDRSQHAGKIVAAFQYLPLFAMQGPHTLPVALGRALLDPHLGAFRSAAEGCEYCDIPAHVHSIVFPVTGSDHTDRRG